MPPETPLRLKIQQEYRAAILEAALDTFAEHGFHDAQMREIASRAGVAVGTLYNLFGGKEDLYSELIRRSALELGASMSEWLQQELPPLQTLLDYLELKAELLQANRKMLKLYVSGIGFGFGTFSSGLPPDIREAQFRFLRSEAEVFRSAIETGDIRPELEPFDLAVSYENIANGFIQLDLEFPELHPFEAKIPGILRMFFSSAVTAKAEPLVHSRLNRYASPEGEAS